MCEIAFTLGNQGVKDTHSVEGIMAYSDSGLPGMLFSLLDQEEDEVIVVLHSIIRGCRHHHYDRHQPVITLAIVWCPNVFSLPETVPRW